MYTLTLTKAERKAIDWVGGRYSHGNELYRALIGDGTEWDKPDWNEEYDITIKMPEHVAWELKQIAEDCCYHWDCFSRALAEKLTEFVENVV